MDGQVLDVLRGIDDPEIGVNVVDLGLVYRAERDAGAVAVEMTATSRSCPLGEFMREEARTRLEAAFPDVAVAVELVWTPPWKPGRMSAAARSELGL